MPRDDLDHHIARCQHGRTVGDDHDGRAGGGVFAQGGEHALLALGVEVGGGFVEEQDRAVGGQNAGEGEALALAEGQAGAVLTDDGVPAVGELGQHGLESRCGTDGSKIIDGRVRDGPEQLDILAQCPGNQHRPLRQPGDPTPPAVEVEFTNIGAVDEDGAFIGCDQPQNRLHRGGFPAPVRPGQDGHQSGFEHGRQLIGRGARSGGNTQSAQGDSRGPITRIGT